MLRRVSPVIALLIALPKLSLFSPQISLYSLDLCHPLIRAWLFLYLRLKAPLSDLRWVKSYPIAVLGEISYTWVVRSRILVTDNHLWRNGKHFFSQIAILGLSWELACFLNMVGMRPPHSHKCACPWVLFKGQQFRDMASEVLKELHSRETQASPESVAGQFQLPTLQMRTPQLRAE